jgi:hypothetical protein
MSVRIEHWGDEPNRELKDDTPLWRYMKLSTLLLLLDGKAFFPSVATLQNGDCLECICDPDTAWLQNELSGDPTRYRMLRASIDEWLKKHGPGGVPSRPMYHYEEHYVEILRQQRAVWCWHNSEMESAAMWRIYGERGIAVKTDVASLKAALPTGEFLIARIKYLMRDPQAPSFWHGWDRTNDPQLVLRPFLIKSAEYAHESEVRVVAFCQPRVPGWVIEGIDAKKLIKEVVVSRFLPHDEFCAIERSLRMRFGEIFPPDAGFGPRLRRSILLGGQIEDDQLHAFVAQHFSNQPPPIGSDYIDQL